MQSFSREIAGTAVWCLIMRGVRLWEVSVSGGSTVSLKVIFVSVDDSS